ncbi:MAG: amidohydrolase family protein [Gammaproteobacteria bacterium]|nr:amidohydrolase family protein [Gammaproteobacteria bacterium]MYE83246.1 amidohydrolase family protein [Gammaproteobacteria bacterium]
MTYASGRTYYDADSHIVELPDHLKRHADPDARDAVPDLSFDVGSAWEDTVARLIETRSHTEQHRADLIAQGDDLLRGPKMFDALGAFDPEERSTALDLLGFERQLVFASFSTQPVFDRSLDADTRYSNATLHNRAMDEFTRGDERLMGVGAVALDDPERAVAELDHLLRLGLATVWIPHRDCGGRSPGHDDFDPFWARLQEARVPFVLHVGGDALRIDPVWTNNGRAAPTDWLGGGENIRGKDMTALHHGPERFVGILVLDGVFERFPRLTGAAVELGAGYVPAMLHRLDWIHQIWRRSEPELAAFTRKPSEQLTEQFAFTPFVYEDVGALIRQSNPDLYLFSSDYPHVEGGRDPIGRFEGTLTGLDATVHDRFYSENFARVFDVS